VLDALMDELPLDGTVAGPVLMNALRQIGFERAGLFVPLVEDGVRSIGVERLDDFDGLDVDVLRQSFILGPTKPHFFDLASPEPGHRNRVLSVRETFGARSFQGDTLRRAGFDLATEDITRVLLCDEHRVLAWVGGSHSAPLAAEAIEAFESVVPALRARFIVHRKLREAAVASSGLVVALDRLSAPAFIVRRGGRVEYANDEGARLLTTNQHEVRTALATAVDVFEGGATSGLEVTPLADGRHWLVVYREGVVNTRVVKAASSWGLTARQRDVLHGIVGGDANKTIASRLSCTEATVEAHATAIYRKARVDSRSALIEKLLAI
jgi:DNA-binding CsgD family transcriptional regulator